ncbi:threonine synthase [Roseiconus lacunae]|uniref:Pyridoxal-phosphate dependent enzyme n=1 Tax=Roseiconus lacunae TaxID=2605694 RepID=A0ABT7PNV4_9BACT|nr:pyridoxal-phosphate dependent enzyme [Roseiconus lacunae]MDM4018194.1 pyridoxal-phosphate dependent enzyme [Roseiconus lacunae]
MSTLKRKPARSEIRCSICNRPQEIAGQLFCQHDDSPLVAVPSSFDTERKKHTNFSRRFADVLPLSRVASCRESESLNAECRELSSVAKRYGIGRLFVQNECGLPTGTTKARMAAGTLAHLYETGVRDFVVVSTGNSTSAMTRLLKSYPEMHMHAFCGIDFVQRHRLRDTKNIRFHAVTGDFVEAGRQAKEFARKKRLVWEGGFFNPVRRISLATAYLEACDEIGDSPHWYIQAVSSAMGLVGVGEMADAQRAAGVISRFPRLVGVQQETCAPMVRAFDEGCLQIEPRHVVKNPSGIATAILRGDPTSSYPMVRQHVLNSKGTLESVSQADILNAQRYLRRKRGIPVGGAAAAAFAAVIKMGKAKKFRRDEVVLVNLTGRF